MARLLLVGLVVLFTPVLTDDDPIVALAKSKMKDPAKPFTLTVTAKVKDGLMPKMKAAFTPCATATRKEPGCLSYEMHTDPDKSGVIVLIERWKSVAALESHLKQTYTQAFVKTVPEWIDGSPEFKVLVVME